MNKCEISPVDPSEITKYTANDFLMTPAPFEFLYDFRQNKFQMAQIRELLKRHAASVGVKNFNSLWNNYLEEIQGKHIIPMDNVTTFSDQPLELYSGPFCCDDEGVTIPSKYGDDTIVCLHPIMPVRRLVNVDSGEERMELAFRRRGRWKTIIVEKATVASATSIIQLARHGICVNSENARDLSTYLMQVEQLNEDVLPEELCVGHMGWIQDVGFAPFVPDVGFDGDNGFRQMRRAIRKGGSFDEWKKAMLELRALDGPGRFFLAASFASVILEPCGLLPFFLHAYGGSEFGKTVGLMAAASVWADPHLGEYITTFDATQVGQEKIAVFLKNLPMCIDELQIKESMGEKDFDKIIYHLSEGVGRARGSRDGGLQDVGRWRNCFISTGERPISNPSSKGGAINRIVEIEIADRIHPDLPGFSDVIKRNYGHAGPAFIDALEEIGFDFVRQQQKEFYKRLQDSPATDKQAAAGSALLAADQIATLMIFHDDRCLTIDDLLRVLSTKDDVNINLRALDFIRELPSRYPTRFEENAFKEWTGERWGKVSDGYIYILRGAFSEILHSEGYSPTAFLGWAQRQGLLITDPGRRDKVCRTWNKVERFIVLKEE